MVKRWNLLLLYHGKEGEIIIISWERGGNYYYIMGKRGKLLLYHGKEGKIIIISWERGENYYYIMGKRGEMKKHITVFSSGG
jgi:transposase